MSVSFRSGFPQTTEGAVRDFEAAVGFRLPEDYREFLLKDNGGQQPEPDCFRVETGEITAVSVLFPIGKSGDYYDLSAHFEYQKDELPRGVIPIGKDIGGNTICLALDGEERGSVLFMEHEAETGPHEEGWDNLYFCARSFTEFLDGLRD